MGAANVIPGVSGGTVAFITGIYERLLNAIKSFDMTAIRLIKKKRIGDFLKHIDFAFLFVLGLGVLVSIVTLAKVLKDSFENYPIYTSAVFFGLIALSVLSVARMVKKWNVLCYLFLLIGCGIAVSLSLLDQAPENREYWYLAICGVVAMCSMIMPGVSGSFVLLLMGNYILILDSVNKLREQKWNDALPIIIPVGVGAVIGVAVLSRFLSWLFKKYHDIATALITGFVAGSLAILWPWKKVLKEKSVYVDGKLKSAVYERYLPEISSQETLIAIGFIVAGGAVMFAIDFLGKKKLS